MLGFAIATAIVAAFAFNKQSDAVRDGRQLIGQQKDMLQVQSDRLDVYRGEVDEQRRVNAERGEVLELQAREIRASLEERERTDEEKRRSQASKATAWLERLEHDGAWKAHIRNASDLCIFDVRVFFHEIRKRPGEGRQPVSLGNPPPRDETICVFPPSFSRSVAVPENVLALFPELNDRTCVVSIQFTDAAENQWERDPRGALVLHS